MVIEAPENLQTILTDPVSYIAEHGLPAGRPILETEVVVGKFWSGVWGQPMSRVSQDIKNVHLQPRTIIRSTDWGPHNELLQLVKITGAELTAALIKSRDAIDTKTVFTCLANLATAAWPSQRILNEEYDNHTASAKKYHLARQELNRTLLITLIEVSGHLGSSDLDAVVSIMLADNSIDQKELGMITKLSRWSTWPLDEINSLKYLQILNGKQDYGNKSLKRLISGFIHGVTPGLTLDQNSRKLLAQTTF